MVSPISVPSPIHPLNPGGSAALNQNPRPRPGVLLFGEFPPFPRRIQQPAPIAAAAGRAELAACMGARAASMRRLSAMPSSRVSTRATRPVESETSARNPAVSGPQSVLHREHAGPQPRLRSRRDDRGMLRDNLMAQKAPGKHFRKGVSLRQILKGSSDQVRASRGTRMCRRIRWRKPLNSGAKQNHAFVLRQ